MKHRRNWIIGIILSVTAAFAALQTVSAPHQDSPLSTPPVTVTQESAFAPPTESPTAEAVVSPSDTPAFQGCSYSWAYLDAPELTQALDAAVKKMDPAASAVATQFGEDCHKGDGSVTFGAMETDFYIRKPVTDLLAEDAFGNWMHEVMQIVIQIPRDQIPGPNYGFVEFTFEKSESERVILRVPIQEYISNAQELTGAELFQLFISKP